MYGGKNMSIVDDLQEMSRKIAEAQSKKDQEEGQKRQLLSQLKNEFGINSLTEAKEECKKRAEKLEKTRESLERDIKILKEESKW